MRGKLFLGFVLLFVLLITTISLPTLSETTQSDNRIESYPVYGIVYNSTTNEPVPNAYVYIKNERTNEILSTTTNSNGKYIIECLNFPSGLKNGDTLLVSASYGNLTAIKEITVKPEDIGKRVDLYLTDPSEGSPSNSQSPITVIVANSDGRFYVNMFIILVIIIASMFMWIVLNKKRNKNFNTDYFYRRGRWL